MFLREYFGFFSSERTGITTLTLILLFVIILPRFFRNDEISVEDTDRLKKEMDIFLAEMERQSVKHKPDTVFIFDPNTVDSASLVLLGFSPLQAKSIVSYRNKGGRFYSKESFGKSYVVSEEMFARLYYHIDIRQEAAGNRQKADKADKVGKPKENRAIAEVKENRESKNTVKKPYTVELNSANFDELQKFRGIGEYYAKKIIEYRDKLGGFYSAEQLMEIRGIDSARFDMFRDQILIDTSHIRSVKINAVTEKELAKHPYINNYIAKAIITYRKFRGKITSGDEMLREKVITEKQLEKIAAYIEY
jgi:competence ComEA-like helix-hairpin-helix protein